MKRVVILFLMFSFVTYANNEPNKNVSKVKSYAKSKTNNLGIVTHENEKYGKHIFIVSDYYKMKKITFYNIAGQKVYTLKTVGEPISLNMFVKGLYYIKIKEGNKTIFREILID